MSTREEILSRNMGSNIFSAQCDTNNISSTNNRVHRVNKSNIHFGDHPHEDYIVKKDKTTKKDYNSEISVESAYQRKIRELNPNQEKFTNKNSTSTFGAFTKENNEEDQKKLRTLASPEISAKERKLIQMSPNLSNEEIKKHLSESNVIDQNSNYINNNSTNSAKDRKTQFLYNSNIFNENNEKQINSNNSYHKEEKEEKIEINRKPKVTVPTNPWRANLDWRDPKFELIFKNEYPSTEDCSPFKRKIKESQDHFESSNALKDSDYIPNLTDVNEEKVTEDRQSIRNSLQEIYLNDHHKLRKNIELSSVNQKDFYSQAVKNSKVNDRPVSHYEVKDIKDFENLKLKEVQNMFIKKGIHIYDIKSTGDYINGNTNGTLEFKIREKNNDNKYYQNLDDIKSSLKNEMGLEVKPKVTSSAKKFSDTLPTDVKWNNSLIHKYIKNKLDNLEKTENITQINTNSEIEKLSKGIKINTSYKNNKGINKYESK